MSLNNSTIHDRLKMIMEHYSLNRREFSLRIGVNEGMMSNYVGGRLSKPGSDILEKILLSFDKINARWLLTNEGEMLLNENGECSECGKKDRLLESQDKHIGRLEKQIAKYEGNLIEQPKTKLGSGSSGTNTPTRLSRSE